MMEPGTSSARTPPLIVEASENPNDALKAFIAQELEHWGFDVPQSDFLDVRAGKRRFRIIVWSMPQEAQ